METVSSTSLADLDLRGTGYCASFNFRRTARAITQLFDRALVHAGIRSTQFTILVGIAKIQPTPIHTLSSVLMLDPTTLTRSLRLMQKEGLLTVSKRSAKRQRLVMLTARGEQVLATSLPLWREIQSRFVDSVGSSYWINFRNDLEQLANLANTLGRPTMEAKEPGSSEATPTSNC
jgi:DNA-binding MarR family transcriptional regulator